MGPVCRGREPEVTGPGCTPSVRATPALDPRVVEELEYRMEGPGSQHFGARPPGVAPGLSLEAHGILQAGLDIEEQTPREGGHSRCPF